MSHRFDTHDAAFKGRILEIPVKEFCFVSIGDFFVLGDSSTKT